MEGLGFVLLVIFGYTILNEWLFTTEMRHQRKEERDQEFRVRQDMWGYYYYDDMEGAEED